jgi:hypothetical protein
VDERGGSISRTAIYIGPITILSVNRCSHQYSWQFTTAAVLGVLPIHLSVECSRTGPGLDEILIAAASGKEASSEVMSYHLWFSV